jgi:hypothetical protein
LAGGGVSGTGDRKYAFIPMAIYSVIHGQNTAMASKEGWYVKKTDGDVTIIDHLYKTWLEAKAEANRLSELEKSNAPAPSTSCGWLA